jgi:hypothetical protein
LVTDSNVKLAKNGCNSGEVRPDGHQKRGTSDTRQQRRCGASVQHQLEHQVSGGQ